MTVQDVADDTSFQAHFDRIRKLPQQQSQQSQQQYETQQQYDNEQNAHTPTEESKQSSYHINTTPANAPATTTTAGTVASSTSDRGRARLADTGHFITPSTGSTGNHHNHNQHNHSSSDEGGRVYKLRARGTNSNHMDSVLSAHEQV